MKKKRLLLVTLAVLSACTLAFAFTACDDTPPPSGDDPSQTTPGGNDPDDPKPVDPTPVDPTPVDPTPVDPTPEKIDVGVFARKWVNAEQTLDLVSHTLTGATDFKVTALTGENAETAISCTANAKDYVLKLNEDGALAMYEATAAQDDEEAEPTAVFMADATPFAGGWEREEDPDDYFNSYYVYYSVSPELNDEGMFDVATLSKYNNEASDSNVATTRFAFDEDGNYSLSFVAIYYGYDYFTFTLDHEGNYTVLDEYYDEYNLVPYGFNFTADDYLTEKDSELSVDGEAKKVAYANTEAEYTLEKNTFGAGYAFTAGGTKYLLSYYPSGLTLVSADETLRLAVNDPSAIIGEWVSGNGNITLTVNEDLSVELVRSGVTTTVDVQPTYNAGAVKYNFTTSSNVNTIKSILGAEGNLITAAIEIESTDNNLDGYFINAEVRNMFFGEYTDNLNALTIRNDQTITIHDKVSNNADENYTGFFTYNETLECVELMYEQGSRYSFVMIGEGVFWTMTRGTLGSSDTLYYQNIQTWLDETALEEFKDAFTDALNTASDVFTSGVNGTTVDFDFSGEIAEVLLNGKRFRVIWDSDLSLSDVVVPQIAFFDLDEGADLSDPELRGTYYTLASYGTYLSLTPTALPSYEEDETIFLVSKAEFESYFGETYVYNGLYFEEKFTISEDGVFSITTTDLTDGNSAVVMKEYNYVVMNNADLGFIFAFEADPVHQIHIFVYIKDHMSAEVAGVTYVRESLASYVGKYYSTDGTYVELKENGNVSIGNYTSSFDIPSTGKLPDTYTIAEGVLTFDVAVGFITTTTYTVSINGTTGVATITEKTEGAQTREFAKGILNPFVFAGYYEFGEDDTPIIVTLTAMANNIMPGITATVDGDTFTSVLSFDQTGKQMLTLTRFDEDYNEIIYKLVYDGTKITVTHDDVSKDFTGERLTDYSAFSYTGTKVYTDRDGVNHELVCLPKEGGLAPLYFLRYGNDEKATANNYVVTQLEDGKWQLSVSVSYRTLKDNADEIEDESDKYESHDYTIRITSDGETVELLSDVPPAPPIIPPPPFLNF